MAKNGKIAVVTLPGNFNYGNRLQAYALAAVVKEMTGSDVEHVVPIIEKVASLRRFKLFVQAVLSRKVQSFFIKVKKEQAIKPFSDKYLHEVRMGRGAFYDYAIVGSDQVWHPGGVRQRNLKRYFLTFVSPEKRIAYAPSFGLSSIPKDKRAIYKQHLLSFAHTSVREVSGQKIIKHLTGSDVPVVLDPTLLLTAANWKELTKDEDVNTKGKRYLLRYTLGTLSDKDEQQIARYAKDNNLEIYQIMGDSMESGGHGEVPTVVEFLSRIENAQAVFTDSFHACVFSTIFHTPFVAVKRPGADMSSRITTLLNTTGMTQNFYTGDRSFVDILSQSDFSKVDLAIEKRKVESLWYLRAALGVDRRKSQTSRKPGL